MLFAAASRSSHGPQPVSASHGQATTYGAPNTFLPWPAPAAYPSHWCPSADPSQPSLTPGHADTCICTPFTPAVSPCRPNPHQANTTRFRPFPVDCPPCPHLAPTALPAPPLPAQSLRNQLACVPPPTCTINCPAGPTILHNQLPCHPMPTCAIASCTLRSTKSVSTWPAMARARCSLSSGSCPSAS